MSKRVFRNLRELLDVVKPITTGGVLTAQSDGSFEFTDSSAPDLSSYAPLAGATFTGPLVLSPTGTSRALTINQPLLATQDAIQVNAPGGSGGDLFKLDKDGNAAFAGTVTPGSPVVLGKGGTGANLAATGPGFIRQLTMGAALTVAALTAADLGSGSPTGNFLRGDLTWSDVPSTPPGGTGTELQYRNGSAFGAVTGSSVSGGTIVVPFFSGDGSNLTNLPAAQIVGTVPLAHGGTGQTTAAAGFNALSPLTALGDLLYGGASGAGTRLAGNTTITPKFLAQTGDGVNSAAPSWATVTVPTAADPSATIGLTAVPGTATTYMRSDGAPALSTNVAWLAGRSGGQTLNGDTATGGNLTLVSTAHATKGKILFGTSAYDEVNNRLGVGTQSPACLVQAISSVTDIRFSTGNSGATPTVAAINTGSSGKAAAIVAGTTGAGFCYDSGGVFVIIAESHSAFTGNTLGAGTTVAQFNSDGTSTFNFPLTISDTSNLQKGLKILATGAPRIDLYQSGNASSRNWTILPDTAAFGDLSILQSSAAGGNPVTAGVNRLYISPTGKIGFGNVTAPLSAVDVNGGIAVGNGFAGVTAAPTDGMIIKGNVGIGSNNPTAKLGVIGANGNGISVTNQVDSTLNIFAVGSGQYRIGTDASGRWFSLASDAGVDVLSVRNGRALIGTTTDDGVNKIQVNGSASISNGMTVLTGAAGGSPAVFRQTGGTAGASEVQVYHDGTNGWVSSKAGVLKLAAATATLSNVMVTTRGSGPAALASDNASYRLVVDAVLAAPNSSLGWQTNSLGNLAPDSSTFQLLWGGDAGLVRNAANVLRVTNGSSGYGSLLAAGGTFNANGAASTPALLASGTWFTGGTGTTTKPQLLIEPAGTTSTAWSINGTGVGVNAPSGYTGNLFDGQVNGVSKASIGYDGSLLITDGKTVKGGGAIITLGDGFGTNSAEFLGALTVNGGSTSAPGLFMKSGSVLKWSSDLFYSAADAGLARNSAGIVRVTNGSAGTGGLILGGTYASASGTDKAISVTPSYNQTSTAGSADLFTNRTETAIGSGPQYLLQQQVGGVNKFLVDRTGSVYVPTNGSAAAPSLSIGTNSNSGFYGFASGTALTWQGNQTFAFWSDSSFSIVKPAGNLSIAGDICLSRPAANVFRIGANSDGTGNADLRVNRAIGLNCVPLAGLDVQTPITAASGVAYGQRNQQTLTAAANSDVLNALLVNPTFTNGAFTSVTNSLARFQNAGVDKFAVDSNGRQTLTTASNDSTPVWRATTGTSTLSFWLATAQPKSQIGTETADDLILFANNSTRLRAFASGGVSVGGSAAPGNNCLSVAGSLGIGGNIVPIAGLDVQTPISAASGAAYGGRFQQTLTATANSDVLNAHLVNATSVPGAFTGVTTYLYRGQNAGADKWWVDKSGNSYFAGLPRIDSPATAPSTQVLSAMPLTVYGGSSAMMGAPDGWLLANVNGMNVKIPYML